MRDSILLKSRAQTYEELKEAILEFDEDTGNLHRMKASTSTSELKKNGGKAVEDGTTIDTVKALYTQLLESHKQVKRKLNSEKWKKKKLQRKLGYVNNNIPRPSRELSRTPRATKEVFSRNVRSLSRTIKKVRTRTSSVRS